MLRPQEVASTNSEVRDPFDSRYYSTVFDAQVLVSGGRVDLMKSNPAGEVAPVEKEP
jgi:type IV secretory pathway protease TraF